MQIFRHNPNAPFRRDHRPITSTVTREEHARLSELARRAGKAPTTYATQVLREHLASAVTVSSEDVQ